MLASFISHRALRRWGHSLGGPTQVLPKASSYLRFGPKANRLHRSTRAGIIAPASLRRRCVRPRTELWFGLGDRLSCDELFTCCQVLDFGHILPGKCLSFWVAVGVPGHGGCQPTNQPTSQPTNQAINQPAKSSHP